MTRADLANTIVFEVLWSTLNFTVVRKIAAEPSSGWSLCGYIAGNVLGSVASILVTKHFWGS